MLMVPFTVMVPPAFPAVAPFVPSIARFPVPLVPTKLTVTPELTVTLKKLEAAQLL